MDNIIERNYTVEVSYNEEKQIVLREDWWHGGRRHRDGAPSHIVRDNETGRIVKELWNREGRTERDGDLPAETQWDRETGVPIYEAYYFWGNLDRKTGPAVIKRDASTGTIVQRAWYHSGLLGRHDAAQPGPSFEIIDPETRVVTLEQYHFDGKLHRRDGPSVIERSAESGQVLSTRYFLYDKELNSLPAFIAPPEL